MIHCGTAASILTCTRLAQPSIKQSFVRRGLLPIAQTKLTVNKVASVLEYCTPKYQHQAWHGGMSFVFYVAFAVNGSTRVRGVGTGTFNTVSFEAGEN